MHIIFFENNQIENLYPITLTRPGFDILCGGATLYNLIKRQIRPAQISYLIRDYLIKIAKIKYPTSQPKDNQILFLNSRLVPYFKTGQFLISIIKKQNNIIFKNQNQILGAYLNLTKLNLSSNQIKKLDYLKVGFFLSGLKLKKVKVDWPIFNHSWEVITYNQKIILGNLNYFKNDFVQIQPNVYVGKKVKIAENVFLNTEAGPILINDQSQIQPFSYLSGPLFIGQNCQIKEFTALKNGCCLGDVSRVGGEIEATVIQGYANKQHIGFLGHSYLGEWVNLGAGTTNSNLKNNYGAVKINGFNTGQQFLGCVIGDYSKTAINVSIYTGKIIGVNSFLYGAIVSDIPSFTDAGDLLKTPVEFPLTNALEIQKIIFSRRQIKQTQAHSKLLNDVYNLTKKDRLKARIKKGKLTFRG